MPVSRSRGAVVPLTPQRTSHGDNNTASWATQRHQQQPTQPLPAPADEDPRERAGLWQSFKATLGRLLAVIVALWPWVTQPRAVSETPIVAIQDDSSGDPDYNTSPQPGQVEVIHPMVRNLPMLSRSQDLLPAMDDNLPNQTMTSTEETAAPETTRIGPPADVTFQPPATGQQEPPRLLASSIINTAKKVKDVTSYALDQKVSEIVETLIRNGLPAASEIAKGVISGALNVAAATNLLYSADFIFKVISGVRESVDALKENKIEANDILNDCMLFMKAIMEVGCCNETTEDVVKQLREHTVNIQEEFSEWTKPRTGCFSYLAGLASAKKVKVGLRKFKERQEYISRSLERYQKMITDKKMTEAILALQQASKLEAEVEAVKESIQAWPHGFLDALKQKHIRNLWRRHNGKPFTWVFWWLVFPGRSDLTDLEPEATNELISLLGTEESSPEQDKNRENFELAVENYNDRTTIEIEEAMLAFKVTDGDSPKELVSRVKTLVHQGGRIHLNVDMNNSVKDLQDNPELLATYVRDELIHLLLFANERCSRFLSLNSSSGGSAVDLFSAAVCVACKLIKHKDTDTHQSRRRVKGLAKNVNLEGQTDMPGVLTKIADELGTRPAESISVESIIDHLSLLESRGNAGSYGALLILSHAGDNLLYRWEQEFVRLICQLLDSIPGLRIIVTSRMVISIPAEVPEAGPIVEALDDEIQLGNRNAIIKQLIIGILNETCDVDVGLTDSPSAGGYAADFMDAAVAVSSGSPWMARLVAMGLADGTLTVEGLIEISQSRRQQQGRPRGAAAGSGGPDGDDDEQCSLDTIYHLRQLLEKRNFIENVLRLTVFPETFNSTDAELVLECPPGKAPSIMHDMVNNGLVFRTKDVYTLHVLVREAAILHLGSKSSSRSSEGQPLVMESRKQYTLLMLRKLHGWAKAAVDSRQRNLVLLEVRDHRAGMKMLSNELASQTSWSNDNQDIVFLAADAADAHIEGLLYVLAALDLLRSEDSCTAWRNISKAPLTRDVVSRRAAAECVLIVHLWKQNNITSADTIMARELDRSVELSMLARLKSCFQIYGPSEASTIGTLERLCVLLRCLNRMAAAEAYTETLVGPEFTPQQLRSLADSVRPSSTSKGTSLKLLLCGKDPDMEAVRNILGLLVDDVIPTRTADERKVARGVLALLGQLPCVREISRGHLKRLVGICLDLVCMLQATRTLDTPEEHDYWAAQVLKVIHEVEIWAARESSFLVKLRGMVMTLIPRRWLLSLPFFHSRASRGAIGHASADVERPPVAPPETTTPALPPVLVVLNMEDARSTELQRLHSVLARKISDAADAVNAASDVCAVGVGMPTAAASAGGAHASAGSSHMEGIRSTPGPHQFITQPALSALWHDQFYGKVAVPWQEWWSVFPSRLGLLGNTALLHDAFLHADSPCRRRFQDKIGHDDQEIAALDLAEAFNRPTLRDGDALVHHIMSLITDKPSPAPTPPSPRPMPPQPPSTTGPPLPPPVPDYGPHPSQPLLPAPAPDDDSYPSEPLLSSTDPGYIGPGPPLLQPPAPADDEADDYNGHTAARWQQPPVVTFIPSAAQIQRQYRTRQQQQQQQQQSWQQPPPRWQQQQQSWQQPPPSRQQPPSMHSGGGRRRRPRRFRGECWYCHAVNDHPKSECPERDRNEGRCFKCHERGHMEWQCVYN